MNKVIKFLKKLKPIKYMSLLIKYNNLENDYEVLKNAVEKNLFKEVLSKIVIPEENEKLQRDNERLRQRIKKLEKEK